jgi:hypothetical protein
LNQNLKVMYLIINQWDLLGQSVVFHLDTSVYLRRLFCNVLCCLVLSTSSVKWTSLCSVTMRIISMKWSEKKWRPIIINLWNFTWLWVCMHYRNWPSQKARKCISCFCCYCDHYYDYCCWYHFFPYCCCCCLLFDICTRISEMHVFLIYRSKYSGGNCHGVSETVLASIIRHWMC